MRIKKMDKLQRKAIWIEFKSDIQKYGILNALNNLSFEIGYLRTLPFSEDREILFDTYNLRKAKIAKFRRKFLRG